MSKGISETAFASQVEDLFKIYNWRWIHFRPAWSSKGYRTPIKGHKGFPDYVAVRPPRLLFIELKDQYSKTTPEQEAWLEDLRECVKTITLEPIPLMGSKMMPELASLGETFNTVQSLEVYLWRPKDIDQITLILR